MSALTIVDRDERTLAVENASYRLVYLFLAFALLLDVAYRSFVRQESAWDLLVLVIAAGALATLYQAKHKVLTAGWVRLVILTAALAGTTAALIALLS
jgi:hypothetical protein